MMKNKRVYFLFIIFAMGVFLVNFVSAQDVFEKTKGFFGNFYDSFLEPTFRFLLNSPGQGFSGQDFFTKILLFVIVLAIVVSVLRRVPLFNDKTSIATFIGLAFSILSVRLISDEWLKDIFLPYTAVGVALSVLLPLVIIVWFVLGSGMGRTMQRFMWVFISIMFIAIYFLRRDELGPIAAWYGVAVFFSLLAVLFTNQINGFMHRHRLDTLNQHYNEEMLRTLRRRLHEAHEDLRNGVLSTIQFNTIRADLLTQMNHFSS